MKTLADEIAEAATRGFRQFMQEKQAEYNRTYHMNAQTKELRLVTRGRYKDRTVRMMSEADSVTGLVKCALPKRKKNQDGSYSETDESTEIMLSEGQLQLL